MQRALSLLSIFLRGTLNRIRFDFVRELVVFLSGGIVLITFAYIMNDFLNVQISGLSAVMRDRFASPLATVALLLAGFYSGNVVRNEILERETATSAARFIGENPQTLRAYHLLFGIFWIAVLHGGAWWLTHRYLVKMTIGAGILHEALMLAAAISGFFWYRGKKSEQEHTTADWLEQNGTTDRISSFVRWRLAQMFLRNRTAHACFAIAFFVYLLLIPLQAKGIPFFASVACTILAAIIGSSAIFFQLAEDLNYAWAERTMGIAHEDFCRGYKKISMVLAAALTGCSVLCYGAGHLLFGGGDNFWSNVLTLVLINSSTAFMAPSLMFQIDARRPMINMILLAIGSMFVGTAIFANWLSVLLILAIEYYAHGSQNGRFYRA